MTLLTFLKRVALDSPGLINMWPYINLQNPKNIIIVHKINVNIKQQAHQQDSLKKIHCKLTKSYNMMYNSEIITKLNIKNDAKNY